MPLINPAVPNDGDFATAASVDVALRALIALVNGGLDADNIVDAIITTAKLADLSVTNAKIAANTIDLGAKVSSWDGWIKITDTWAYASATTITVPSDATAKYDVGDIIKYTQGGTVMYARVTAVTSTLLTVRMVGSSTLTNVAFSNIYYSKARNPHGFFTAGGGDWWTEIGRTQLTVAGNTITVDNLPLRNYLMIIIRTVGTGGTLDSFIRFNNDSGSNYSWQGINGGGFGTGTSQNSIPLEGANSPSGGQNFTVVEFSNTTSQEKVGNLRNSNPSTAGAANVPIELHTAGKWANTSAQISRVDAINSGTGNFAIGSEVIVLGHN